MEGQARSRIAPYPIRNEHNFGHLWSRRDLGDAFPLKYNDMKKIIIALAICILATGAVDAQNAKNGKRNKRSKAASALQEPALDTCSAISNLIQVSNLIIGNYVDNPEMNKLQEEAISAMLTKLDPHSMFIPARNVERANESLQGNFEGVGITFSINNDTINVGEVIVGGPAEKVGIQMGDKILFIDHKKATGDSINNAYVTKHLRGKKGTKVEITVLRAGYSKPIDFTVMRDKVPIYSVDCYFMVDDSIGYIRLSRYARSSAQEVAKALQKLKADGMKSLIFDLRGNSGGYLDIACSIVNEFLTGGKTIVYTEGRNSPRQTFKTNSFGNFMTGELVVLVDEYSASAAEITSGAIQDWDRGVIIGRRTFGKGLVQRLFTLRDGSQVRLTNARYYTPSGRCIQKPYDKGNDDYMQDIDNRYKHGELLNADSINFPDSLKYKTLTMGRTVYGGGGIMPDIFIPIDTTRLSDYFLAVRGKGHLNKFPLEWANAHRTDPRVATFEDFLKNYDQFEIDKEFLKYAEGNDIFLSDSSYSVPKEMEAADSTKKTEILYRKSDARTDEYISHLLKAMLARDLFGLQYYTRIMKDDDITFQAAIKTLKHQK